jgi:NTE family protein
MLLPLLAPGGARAECGAAREGHPRVALVLSGGGSRGLAHVGVLEVLEREGVGVDCVAGTSMGAALGALWAAGYPAARIEELVSSIDWQEVFSARRVRSLIPLALRIDDRPAFLRVALEGGKPRLPASRDSDYRLNRLLIRYLTAPGLAAGGDFDHLPRPFRAVATDIANAERVVLARGSLARAVRASMSTPVALPTVSFEGRTLVDGGLTDNTPVDVARAMGADVVVVSEAGAPPLEPEQYRDAYGVGVQVVDTLRRLREQAFTERGDLVIRPELGRHDSEDYSGADELIAAGRRAAEASLPALRALAPAPAARPSPPAVAPARVAAVDITGTSRVTAGLVRAAFGVDADDAFDIDRAVRGLDRVWALGLFETAWVDARSEAGALRLAVDVREAPHVFVELGGAYDEADQVGGFLRIRERNLLGGGERLDLDLAAGVGERGVRTAATLGGLWRSPVGLDVRGHWLTQEPVYYVAGDDVGRTRFVRLAGGGGIHVAIGPDVLLQAGLMAGRVEVESRPGVPVAAGTDDYRMLTGVLAWDRLDNRDLPASGAAVVGRGEKSLTGLGADRDYWRASATARAAAGLGGPFVLEAAAFAGLSGGDVPVYDLFRLGGPRWLPGRPRDERWERQALAFSLAPSVDVHGFRIALYGSAGNVWADRSSISLSDLRGGGGVGLARASRLGLIALDAGIDGDGRTAVYLSVGRPW